MNQISPYLKFDGNTREAMGFYKDCFGGSLTLTTVGESAYAKQMPPETYQKIVHSTLTKGPVTISASDLSGPAGIVKGNSISLNLDCSSEEELRALVTKLSSNGGTIEFPVAPSFWGGLYAQLTDRFGTNWMLNTTPK